MGAWGNLAELCLQRAWSADKHPELDALSKLYKQCSESLKYPAGQVKTSLSNFVFRQCFLFDQEGTDVSPLMCVFVHTPWCTRIPCPCAGAAVFRVRCYSSLFSLITVVLLLFWFCFSRESKLEFREVRLNKVLTYSCSFPYLSLTWREWKKYIYSNAPFKNKKKTLCIYIIDSLTSFLGGRFWAFGLSGLLSEICTFIK